MNLTERDLSRWTGTGVKCLRNGDVYNITLSSDVINHAERLISFYYLTKFNEYKLLLRPNSDLTKPITHNGETFVPIVRLFEMLCVRYNKSDKVLKCEVKTFSDRIEAVSISGFAYLKINTLCFDENPYWILNQLHEWHFACGLDEGLWIDLNTITKEIQ